jgi:uncharacterized membrane protein
MPFCTSCGSEVRPTDLFCRACGTRQTPTPGASGAPEGTGAPIAKDPMRNISPRTASILCYVPIVGWIMSIVVLASPHFARDRVLRFHAFQGIYLFVVWLLIQWVVEPMFGWMPHRGGGRMLHLVANVMELAVFVAWIFMLIKTSQQQFYSLPFIGELADRSVAEQR